MRIGISGGSFNPIHYGHLFIAQVIQDAFQLKKVLFIPAGHPPHKDQKQMIAGKHRLHMVKQAISGNPMFEVSDLEIKRVGITYSFDTLLALKEQYPEAKLFYLVGADVVSTLTQWYRFESVLTLCEFIAVSRSTENREKLLLKIEELSKIGASIHFFDAPSIEISSSQIRKRVAQKQSIRYWVPLETEQYIYEKGLYR